MGKNNPGISELAKVINNRINYNSRSHQDVTEYGTINPNYTLSLDISGFDVPKSEYMVGKNARNLNIGDRVVVIWVSSEPVIIDVIVSGELVGGDSSNG